MTVIPLAALEVPLEFENLRDGITAVFRENEQGLYTTIDHQEQSRSSELSKGTLRTIQVFFESGDAFSSSEGEFEGDVSFRLLLRVAEPSTGDKATLDDENASAAAKQAALLAIDTGAARADLSWDALLRIALRVIMSPLNRDLGLTEFVVGDRKLKTYRKDAPIDHGKLVVVTGSAFISASVTEIMDGDTPVASEDPIISSEIPFKTVSDSDESDPALLKVDIENT